MSCIGTAVTQRHRRRHRTTGRRWFNLEQARVDMPGHDAAGAISAGRFGRLLFRTTALYQHIQKDGESLRAVNANRFRTLRPRIAAHRGCSCARLLCREGE